MDWLSCGQQFSQYTMLFLYCASESLIYSSNVFFTKIYETLLSVKQES